MERLFKIGEVARLTGLTIKTIRYYEEFGLIKPFSVDIYTGYRYYDSINLEVIYKIQFLKSLGFTLLEIKNYNSQVVSQKIADIQAQITKLKDNLNTLSCVNLDLGEGKMKTFVNDIDAVGKWKYVCTASNKQEFLEGESFCDKELLFQTIYFLPKGCGYWVFDRWTKGEIYHFSGAKYLYEIENGILFLYVYNEKGEYETTLVYKKESDKEFTLDDISIKDDTNLEFVSDNDIVGFWEVVDYISISDKNNYVFNGKKEYFIRSYIFKPHGECIREDNKGNLIKQGWTKGALLDARVSTVSNYVIRDISNEKFLFIDWKSGDYTFGGKVVGCYVLRKIR